MVDWFFSLPVEGAIFLVGMIGIIIGLTAVIATDAAVRAVVQRRIAGVDEFADRDDVYSLINKPLDLLRRIEDMRDVIIKSDDEFRQIDMKSFTCATCNVSHLCAFAFDLFNTDGACLDALKEL